MSLFDPRDWDEDLRDANYCPKSRDRRHQRQRTLDGMIVCTFCGKESEQNNVATLDDRGTSDAIKPLPIRNVSREDDIAEAQGSQSGT